MTKNTDFKTWWKKYWSEVMLVFATATSIFLIFMDFEASFSYRIFSFLLFMEVISIPIVFLLILIKLGLVKGFEGEKALCK